MMSVDMDGHLHRLNLTEQHAIRRDRACLDVREQMFPERISGVCHFPCAAVTPSNLTGCAQPAGPDVDGVKHTITVGQHVPEAHILELIRDCPYRIDYDPKGRVMMMDDDRVAVVLKLTFGFQDGPSSLD